MIKVRALHVILMVLLFANLHAQQTKVVRDSIMDARLGGMRPVKVLLKTSIFAPFSWQIPLTGEYRLAGEIMCGRRQSITAGASYLTRSVFFALSQKVGVNAGTTKVQGNGYRIQAAYKYYLVSRKYRPEGIFLALHASLAEIHFNYKGFPDDVQKLRHFNVNLLFGGQFLIKNRVSIELFLGPGYKMNTYTSLARQGYEVMNFATLGENFRSHFKMSAGMNIGIAL
jgi:hypothetical protein